MYGIRHAIKSFGYSLAGFSSALRHEEAFRQELLLFVILAPLGLWLGDGILERVLLVGSLTGVLVVELINSAIEATVDRVGMEHHPLSGRAKDLGSAAVFLSIMIALLVWGGLLLPLPPGLF